MRSWPHSILDGFPLSLSLEKFEEPQAYCCCQFWWSRLRALSTSILNVVVLGHKHSVEFGAPRRRSGPELREGGKAPPLLSSSLLPAVSGRQEARCCHSVADEA
jgi:hypothetical protein